MSTKSNLKATAYQRAMEMLRIGNAAARKAQANNRAKGIPNLYSIDGRIVSDVAGAEGGNPQSENAAPHKRKRV